MEKHVYDSSFDDRKSYIFLVLACLAAYANSLSGDFLFDDTAQIVGNSALHSWQNLINAFTTDVWAFERGTGSANIPPPYYRPLFTIYLTVGYQLFGLWQQGWHLMNLAVHVAATVLAYRLFLNLSQGNTRLSFVAALLFALIPVHVESISWISGIPDPLAALFYIPAIIFYIRWRKESDKKFLIYSLLSFFGALLCKETPIVLPLVLFVWEMTLNRRKEFSANFPAIKQVLIFLAPIVVYLIMRFSVLGKVSWKHPLSTQTPAEYIYATTPFVIVSYLKNLLFPFNLSLIYGTRFAENFGDLIFWVPLTILFGLVALLYFFRDKLTPLMWMAIGLIFIPLLPVLNLQVFHYDYIVQDRYLYLPSIGFVLLAGCWLEKLWTSEKKVHQQAATGIAIILCLAYLAGTVLHNRVWNSEINLWSRAAELKPNSWAVNYNRGLAHLQEKNYESALADFDKSLNLSSFDRRDDLIYINRGLALQALGRKDAAKQDFMKALQVAPRSLEATINLGTVLFDEGNYAAAEMQFKKALELKPSDASANYNLAKTLAKLGRHKEAVSFYQRLLQVEKQNADLMYYAALSYKANGQKEEAAALLNNAYQFTNNETLKKQIADEMQK